MHHAYTRYRKEHYLKMKEHVGIKATKQGRNDTTKLLWLTVPTSLDIFPTMPHGTCYVG